MLFKKFFVFFCCCYQHSGSYALMHLYNIPYVLCMCIVSACVFLFMYDSFCLQINVFFNKYKYKMDLICDWFVTFAHIECVLCGCNFSALIFLGVKSRPRNQNNMRLFFFFGGIRNRMRLKRSVQFAFIRRLFSNVNLNYIHKTEFKKAVEVTRNKSAADKQQLIHVFSCREKKITKM